MEPLYSHLSNYNLSMLLMSLQVSWKLLIIRIQRAFFPTGCARNSGIFHTASISAELVRGEQTGYQDLMILRQRIQIGFTISGHSTRNQKVESPVIYEVLPTPRVLLHLISVQEVTSTSGGETTLVSPTDYATAQTRFMRLPYRSSRCKLASNERREALMLQHLIRHGLPFKFRFLTEKQRIFMFRNHMVIEQ